VQWLAREDDTGLGGTGRVRTAISPPSPALTNTRCDTSDSATDYAVLTDQTRISVKKEWQVASWTTGFRRMIQSRWTMMTRTLMMIINFRLWSPRKLVQLSYQGL